MRGLAEYIMRGSRQATLVVGVCAAVPLLFWLAAAALALVILRRGLQDALSIMIWGGLPALVWAFLGDWTPVLVMAGAAGLATLLRQRNDWVPVVLASVPLGLLFGAVLLMALNAPMQALAAEVRDMLPQLLGDMSELDEATMSRLDGLLLPILAGLIGGSHALLAVVSVMIGRSLQARLYNPGGFRTEFHRLRLTPLVAGGLLLLSLFGAQLGQLAMVAPIATLPLFLAGLALVHGVAGIKGMGVAWLVMFYLLLVLFAQFVFPLILLLALIDSLFDFRGRMQPPQAPPQDPDSNDQP
ncbi:hypothetical protein [Halopseudomonas salegens]|uniref:DUF2232 domain-containing protein n=1 Tax=Halopseudomonas salegens TaxID=1434072 RepID=A0A1H2GID9_9GAMM|nr:hypothetical protein [Halopseudomonas salegens]SDU19151.1 hypothetical protein SAMN05216210_2315 [Halopseudomonas salegens]